MKANDPHDAIEDEFGPSVPLREISTRWSCVHDAHRFTRRYVDAIQHWLRRAVPDSNIADDIAQDFLVKIIQRGFQSAPADSVRFRDYLSRCLRNAVIDHHRRKSDVTMDDRQLADLSDQSNKILIDEDWTRCLVDRVWQSLEQKQFNDPAKKIAEQTGRPLTAAAMRQLVSRGRRLFADILRSEIRDTIEPNDEQSVRDEIASLGLTSYLSIAEPHREVP